MRRIEYLSFIFLCGVSPLFAHVDKLSELNGLKEKLRKERIARVNDKIANYNKLKSLEMKVYSLEDKLSDLKMSEASLEGKLGGGEEEKEKSEKNFTELEDQKKDLENFLEDKKKEISEKIKTGFPCQKKERLSKLKNVKDIAGLFSLLKSEIEFGAECGMFKMPINGKESKVFRVGGIFAVYKSTDGEIGLLRKRLKKGKVEYRWVKVKKNHLKEKLDDLFQKAESGAKVLTVPVDVSQGAKAETENESGGLWGWFTSGGPVMIFIALVALAVIVMAVERIIFFKKEYINADVLMERVIGLWEKGHRDDALNLCRRTSGPVARMLLAALLKHQSGKKVMEETIHQQHLEEIPRLSKNLSAIAVLAGIAPLLGLLGTVSGMISTFQIITYHGGGDPRLLAGGISEALITTEFGLIVAIPALLVHSYLSGRADKIASDMEKNAVKLINSLSG